MGNDLRHLVILTFIMGWFSSVVAQTMPPFLSIKEKDLQFYKEEKQKIETSLSDPQQLLDARIALASQYKHQAELIVALEEKIALQGETAYLRYLLGGANGIRALQVSRIRSLPYVRKMLFNFQRSIALDKTYLPAYEAAVESLCQVPEIIGGSKDKAQEYATKLTQLDSIFGMFSQAYVLRHKGHIEQANAYYKKAFEMFYSDEQCPENAATFFSKTSINFPFKMAVLSDELSHHRRAGLCAIDFFILKANQGYTIPLEWAYLQKGKLHIQLHEAEMAEIALQKAVEINPNFTPAKALLKKRIR